MNIIARIFQRAHNSKEDQDEYTPEVNAIDDSVPAHHHVIRAAIYACIALTVILLGTFSMQVYNTMKFYSDKIYPNISIGDVPVGSLTKDQALQKIQKSYSSTASFTIDLTINKQHVSNISSGELSYSLPLKQAVDKAFALARETNTVLKYKTILMLLSNQEKYRIMLQPHYNNSILTKKLDEIDESFRIEPINARFEFTGNRVVNFKKEQKGSAIDKNTALSDLVETLSSSEVMKGTRKNIAISIQTRTIMPDISLSDINTLGISEMVAQGTSKFQGSSLERIYNITLGAQRLNGVIIKPGEVFSFVGALGEISGATGFKASYVIKSGKTVLGDGGGICQVSTTMFRAALNAGLPIMERHAHTYRVGYYEQESPPGLDATIYAPSVDLKFKNDYENPLLIQTYVDPNTLTLAISFYSTKDERSVDVKRPVISNQIAAPPSEYVDDSTIGAGVVKQVEYSAPGASVYFQYSVSKKGKVVTEDTFYSNYTPWKAVFLRGV